MVQYQAGVQLNPQWGAKEIEQVRSVLIAEIARKYGIEEKEVARAASFMTCLDFGAKVLVATYQAPDPVGVTS